MAEIRGFKDAEMVNMGGGRRPHVARVAYRCDRFYLTGSASAKGLEMSATLSTATISRPLVLVALLVGLLLAATLGLWAYYGTTVFFEMVRTGWVACF